MLLEHWWNVGEELLRSNSMLKLCLEEPRGWRFYPVGRHCVPSGSSRLKIIWWMSDNAVTLVWRPKTTWYKYLTMTLSTYQPIKMQIETTHWLTWLSTVPKKNKNPKLASSLQPWPGTHSAPSPLLKYTFCTGKCYNRAVHFHTFVSCQLMQMMPHYICISTSVVMTIQDSSSSRLTDRPGHRRQMKQLYRDVLISYEG